MNIYPDWLNQGSSNTKKGGVLTIRKGWQLISIPIKNGYFDKETKKLVHITKTKANIQNYILDQIEGLYNSKAETYIAAANTYVGGNKFFYNYIPGVTNKLSVNNFNFSYSDGENEEYVGLWIKSISETPFTIKWGEVGEV